VGVKHLAQKRQVVAAADLVEMEVSATERDARRTGASDQVLCDLEGVGKVE